MPSPSSSSRPSVHPVDPDDPAGFADLIGRWAARFAGHGAPCEVFLDRDDGTATPCTAVWVVGADGRRVPVAVVDPAGDRCITVEDLQDGFDALPSGTDGRLVAGNASGRLVTVASARRHGIGPDGAADVFLSGRPPS